MLDVTPSLDSHQVAVSINHLDPWDDPRSLTTFQTFPRNFRGFGDRSDAIWFEPSRTRNGQLNGSLPSSNGSSILSFDGQQSDDVTVININLKPEDRRFGFSVVGGSDEGFCPRIDTLTKGSPADRADLEVGDEILEVNGRSLENCTHTEVISHIHQCIRSRTICLRVKRKTGTKLALDLAQNSNVQDAFVIAVEQQARERLEKLSALKKIKPVDMTKLSQELNEFPHPELNGVIDGNPIYVTSVPDIQNATLERHKKSLNNNDEESSPDPLLAADRESIIDPVPDQELELTQEIVDLGSDDAPCDNKTVRIVEVNVNVHETDSPPMETMEIRRHREMAVDVPDTFVGVSKTPPRYPPPKPSTDSLNRKKGVPEPPSRVVAKPFVGDPTLSDGKSVIKLQQNGRTSPPKPVNGVTSVDVTSGKHLKDEQIERIRKYQEDLRKRKEEEERIAKEEEFLRSSLRGSKKLQALENNPPVSLAIPPAGVVNTAFELEEGDSGTLPIGQSLPSRLTGDIIDIPDAPELRKIVGAPELLESLHRIETHLKSNGHRSEDLASVEQLMHDAEFQKLLAVHNKVQEIWCFQCPPSPVSNDAADLVQEVINSLQDCSLPEAAELIDILSKYEVEGLIYSHDKIAEKQVVPAMTPDELLLERASQYTEESVKIVRIDKTNEPLGATVRNEGEAVIIGRIVKGGAAEKSGLLHEGDEVLEVNGIEMRGKSVNDVCDILATMVGTLTFLIIPSQYEKKTPSKETVMHIKAHFDYDPDDDLYIPCRELGISFQKGDILHIINQDDPNWWQAYREGEEDQTLAGLIPSKNFQQQREVMKQTIVGEQNKEKSKKAKFLCAKKHHKKKKKKVLYNANEEFDVDQVLTYEEVALYYPRANRKRPIVLIGPPNIGRHELRQRLMENTERFAAAVPHTSRTRRDGEVDGVDYHFITRPQFESDILGGKFVEHGEYEKSYYGTSLEAIRAVVNSGKVCVLNLHPQSLKILKHSDLKPYVVFVAPPSLEKLRQNRLRMGASAKDDELKDIIEKARDMEERYGHYFDMIIINSETEKAYGELVKDIIILEKEPQWVPAIWLSNDPN